MQTDEFCASRGLKDVRWVVPARANGQPALAAYARDERTTEHRAYGVMVFAIDGDTIASITGFPGPDLFGRLGLPLAAQAH